MKVWLTYEKTANCNDGVMLWFDKPRKIYDTFLKRESWTLGEGGVFFYPNLTLDDVNYIVTEENSPLEMDIQFLSEFVVDKSKLRQQNKVKCSAYGDNPQECELYPDCDDCSGNITKLDMKQEEKELLIKDSQK